MPVGGTGRDHIAVPGTECQGLAVEGQFQQPFQDIRAVATSTPIRLHKIGGEFEQADLPFVMAENIVAVSGLLGLPWQGVKIDVIGYHGVIF